MFRHNLVLIYRNYKRFKSTFLINLIGLSTGLACTLLIYLWVTDELYFDKFHHKGNRLFQVMENQHNSESIETTEETPSLLSEALAQELPEVEYALSTTDPAWYGKFNLSTDKDQVKANGQFAGKDFFNVFSYELVQGDKGLVLSDRNSIVISEALAGKLFNTKESAVGKTVEWQMLNRKNQSIVTGVYKNVPSNSSRQFEFILPFEFFPRSRMTWGSYDALTYVVLKPGTDVDAFNVKIGNFIKRKSEGSNITLFAQSYSEKYLYGRYENGELAGGRIEYVRLFSVIAIFILIIACINFMNLSTAKATRRIKEVGIKKAIGAGRRALIGQYLGESMIMTFLSLALGLIIVELFLPQFNQITGKQLALHFDLRLISSMVGIALFTGLIAGSYPALYLSGFNPSIVLKGKLNTSIGELWARKGLVIFQFVLSVIFIVSVLVVYKQIEFVQTKNLGYDKEHVVYFERDGRLVESLDPFLADVKNIPGVKNASSIRHSMMESYSYTTEVVWEGKNPDARTQFENVRVNYDMIETLGIQLAAGRAFSRDFASDTSAVILNEAAVQVMGLKDPLGQTLKLWDEEKRIIGIAKNFHFESLHENIKPFLFRLAPNETRTIMVKIESASEKEVLDKIQSLYHRYNPDAVFDYKFLSAAYQAQYVAEKRVAVLSRYFAGLAILISCLGLFGLASFTAERRIKEIGIRKVLGSSEWGIVYLLSSDFTKIVLASIVIALPVSYVITNYWLDGFAYKIELKVWYFVSAGIMALCIAWFTVGTQAVRVARINPVKSLRSE
jgi:ABC-type antimicrobial peptide transport system permease subunit